MYSKDMARTESIALVEIQNEMQTFTSTYGQLPLHFSLFESALEYLPFWLHLFIYLLPFKRFLFPFELLALPEALTK